MKKHAAILRPKFEICQKVLAEDLESTAIAMWTKPRGGYFISLNLYAGTAARTVSLAADVGVKLTDAGATFPYHKDPGDSNIRIAPSFPKIDELEKGMRVLCLSAKIAVLEKLIEEES